MELLSCLGQIEVYRAAFLYTTAGVTTSICYVLVSLYSLSVYPSFCVLPLSFSLALWNRIAQYLALIIRTLPMEGPDVEPFLQVGALLLLIA